MKWISNLFSRYWRNVHFILIALISLLLVFGNNQIVGHISGGIIVVFHYPFSKINNRILELSNVAKENDRLQQALVEASVKLSHLDEAVRENLRLREILKFDPPPSYSLIQAEVISIFGERVPVSVSINIGLEDSIYIGQPIINREGLVGRVSTVSTKVATVQLLTDPAHRVAVRVADSRDMGIVRYNSSEGMILDNLPIQSRISEGDLVLSSGLGGVFPPGLLVGQVISVEKPVDEPFCIVKLEPATNFNSLEELFILQRDSL